jgi:hypothetical protein
VLSDGATNAICGSVYELDDSDDLEFLDDHAIKLLLSSDGRLRGVISV